MKPRKILTTEPPLLNYAGWYALRYMPSRAKLHEALMKKSDNNTPIVSSVMEQMKGYIREDRVVESFVRMWLDRGKTESYIRVKLREKQFETDIVEQILGQYSEWLSDWKGYEKVATRRITSLIDRGKSRRFIRMTLSGEYPLFSEEIETTLNILCPDELHIIRKEIEKFAQKYNASDPKDRQKIIQKLVGRGFWFDAVKRALSSQE